LSSVVSLNVHLNSKTSNIFLETKFQVIVMRGLGQPALLLVSRLPRGVVSMIFLAGDAELGEDVALGLGELGSLAEGAAGAGEDAEGEQVEVVGDLVPGGGGRGGLGDAQVRGCRVAMYRGGKPSGSAALADAAGLATAALDLGAFVAPLSM
jgi:hypothetical protein